jgi:hypothetical protein
MFVVVWEPRRGVGGGHQAVMDQRKAERISREMMQDRPDDTIRVLSAHEYGASAVMDRDRGQSAKHQ